MALGAACLLLASALIGYGVVHENAYDKCLLTPPWDDLPDDPVRFEVKWRFLPPDSTCVFTLANGLRFERDWTEPPWEKLPARAVERSFAEHDPHGRAPRCTPSARLDYECRFTDGRRLFVAVDRFYVVRRERA